LAGDAATLSRKATAILRTNVPDTKPDTKFQKPSVTVDVILWRPTVEDPKGEILLIQRGHEPCAGSWALPGGFVDPYEPLEKAARRELAEETGISGDFELVQCGAFGDPGRDPRGWTITVAFCGKLEAGEGIPTAGDDAANAKWFGCSELPDIAPNIAFDHADIIEAARKTLVLQ